MMWNYEVGWAGWLVMAATMVAFWALVVFAVVALFRGSGGGSTPAEGRSDHDAERILDQRFARGEIDTEEYHARREALRTTR